MKFFRKKFTTYCLLFTIIFVGAFLRFYNLDWGGTFYFHPDERNIASSVSQLSFPNQMNPHFFAYGSFPIYLIYFTGTLINLLSNFSAGWQLSFSQAILISRFYSAVFSLLLIPLLYLIGRKLKNQKLGFFTAFLTTVSVGFIQYAHFGTFEMWLAFFGVLLFYFCLKILENGRLMDIFLASLTFGILISIKISSLALTPVLILAISLQHLPKIKQIKPIIYKFLFSLSIITLIFIIASPFTILDFVSFLNSVRYEAEVALGTLPVFYTEEFLNTIPIVFQFTKIYPFLLNPLLTFFLIPSLIYVHYMSVKKNLRSYYLLLITYYLLLFSQAFFFAKWIRYMVPTLPFAYLIIAIAISDFLKNLKSYVSSLVVIFIIAISLVFSLSYFVTVYGKPDTRVSGYLWAKENIPSNTKIISEVYDLGIIPFNQNFPSITLFNFYELDQKPFRLPQTDYIILPSQRILRSRLANPNEFPNGHRFYKGLFEGNLGYEKIYETPCDFFCKIAYLGNPIFSFEQTSNVFDRPTVFIFKRK